MKSSEQKRKKKVKQEQIEQSKHFQTLNAIAHLHKEHADLRQQIAELRTIAQNVGYVMLLISSHLGIEIDLEEQPAEGEEE